jgi:hypothetical protein
MLLASRPRVRIRRCAHVINVSTGRQEYSEADKWIAPSLASAPGPALSPPRDIIKILCTRLRRLRSAESYLLLPMCEQYKVADQGGEDILRARIPFRGGKINSRFDEAPIVGRDRSY